MIIDTMDLLYTSRFDGFRMVTSDSDFTGLAVRRREEGLQVFGFGGQKALEAFRNACHKFIFTEVLRPPDASEVAAAQPGEGFKRRTSITDRGGHRTAHTSRISREVLDGSTRQFGRSCALAAAQDLWQLPPEGSARL